MTTWRLRLLGKEVEKFVALSCHKNFAGFPVKEKDNGNKDNIATFFFWKLNKSLFTIHNAPMELVAHFCSWKLADFIADPISLEASEVGKSYKFCHGDRSLFFVDSHGQG